MFSGIVAATGRVTHITHAERGVRLSIDAGGLGIDDVRIGDSIAVSGVCLTVTEIAGNSFVVDVSQETLDCTSGLDALGEVNLEKSLTLADRLGGHLVSGHVDGVGEVQRFAPVGESRELVVRAPRSLARYLARKGSVTLDGVSLTINRVEDSAEGCDISINLIPHTLAVTTLRTVQPGRRVNLEIDLVARYVERMVALGA
jgi:riboflavin synthase